MREWDIMGEKGINIKRYLTINFGVLTYTPVEIPSQRRNELPQDSNKHALLGAHDSQGLRNNQSGAKKKAICSVASLDFQLVRCYFLCS